MFYIDVRGDIINNDDSWYYDWFGDSYTSPKIISEKLKEANGQDVIVSINSPGGDVFSASEIYTDLKEYKGKVITKILGIAASAASVIAMAGNEVKISPTAQIMIHNVYTYTSGDYRDMKHISETLKNANNSIANAYIDKTGKTREEILNLMDDETYLTAQKAKELGFVDEILFEENNNIDINKLSNFKHKGFYNSIDRKQFTQKMDIKNKVKAENHNNDSFFIQQNKILNQKKFELFQNLLNERRGALNENE